MRIAVVNLTNGSLSGGYRKYLHKMLPMLTDDPRVGHVDVFSPPQVTDLPRVSGTSLVNWPASDAWLGYSWLRSQLQRLDVDVVFVPTARWLDCGLTPTVVMVRNMEPLEVPYEGNPFLEQVRNWARARTARNACRRATRVIAVSHYVRDFILARWRLSPAKVGMVYHGVEAASPENSSPSSNSETEVLPESFIFTAGSIRPARGLMDLVEALVYLRDQGLTQSLVVAGGVDPRMRSFKRRLDLKANRLGAADQIRWLNHIDASKMSSCFRRCSVFVTTSRAEACPNIALEAMAHGCRIVATNQPPMPEFFAESALYYTPKNSKELAQKIVEAITVTPEQGGVWRSVAQERAHRFDWATTARRTVDELELACRAAANA